MSDFIVHKDEFHYIENLQIPFLDTKNHSLGYLLENITYDTPEYLILKDIDINILNTHNELIIGYVLHHKRELDQCKSNVIYHRRNKIIEDIL